MRADSLIFDICAWRDIFVNILQFNFYISVYQFGFGTIIFVQATLYHCCLAHCSGFKKGTFCYSTAGHMTKIVQTWSLIIFSLSGTHIKQPSCLLRAADCPNPPSPTGIDVISSWQTCKPRYEACHGRHFDFWMLSYVPITQRCVG